ncbi:MAG: DUF222 domain-containing protein, partial [Acidobacteria bacterium]|nr:DUF222 domain-containing protein [Acidobacteriota bacterium]
QKLLHALVDCARIAVRTRQLPGNGGMKPQLVITMTLEQLTAGRGSLNLPHAGPTSAGAIRRMACDAEVIPMVLGTGSEVLDVGRSVRIISKELRKALISRDGGCAFPSCDRPPQWCEAHHLDHWSHGGTTSLENSALLCSHHHPQLSHTS